MVIGETEKDITVKCSCSTFYLSTETEKYDLP